MSFTKKYWMAALSCLVMMPMAASAQSPNGVGVNKPVVGISYYKVPAGKQDEWLALFKKWHLPIIEEMKREGAITDFKIFIPSFHGKGAGWDIVGITTGGSGAPKEKVSSAARIRKVFPDLAAFEKGEKERWSLTIDHWDEILAEVDIHGEPLSLYSPVGK